MKYFFITFKLIDYNKNTLLISEFKNNDQFSAVYKRIFKIFFIRISKTFKGFECYTKAINKLNEY
tara:strand:- start:247 stop:441 length:195 start_codon:yes stop_codon:yes gene_type:complete